MKLFDLHCDTVTECFRTGQTLCRNNLQLSVSRAQYLRKWCQVFAVWMPDEIRGYEATEYYRKVKDVFLSQTGQNSIVHCKSAKELRECDEKCKNFCMLSVEGGSALGGRIDVLDEMYNDGVRIINLTWNGENELGNGCMSQNKSGLTDFGKKVLERMNVLGITADVSHLNERGFYDVAEFSEKPFIASHSCLDSVNSHKRNLTDSQVKIIAERNGLIGINFFVDFLGRNNSGYDGVYRHLYRLLELGGENAAAIGSDFDGCKTNPQLSGIDKLYGLYDYLLSRNIGEEKAEKIFYGNAMRFFSLY